MSQTIHERLNQIPERILSTEFLTGQGLGNEIGFWIFDYAPEDELKVREYLHFLETDAGEKTQSAEGGEYQPAASRGGLSG